MSAEDYETIEVEEEKPHVDEGWLISYADMMTLLFGLFVLLYSMRFDHIQESLSNKFGAEKPQEQDTKTALVPTTNPQAVDPTKTQLAEMQNKYLKTQAELEKSQADFRQSQTVLEHLKLAVQAEAEKSSSQIKALSEESRRQAAQLSSVAAPAPALQNIPAAPGAPISPNSTHAAMATGEAPGTATGSGGGSYRPYHVSAEFVDGTTIDDDITELRSTRLVLSKPPPLKYAGRFNITVSHNGQNIELTVRATFDNDGHMSKVLEIWSISSSNQNIIDQWLRH